MGNKDTISHHSILVSLVTEPIPGKYLHRLTFWSRHSTEVRLELDKLGKEHEDNYKVFKTNYQIVCLILI